MVMPKQKAVVNLDRAQLAEVERLVASGSYPSVSEFMREAVAEKLERLHAARLAEAVANYCAAGHDAEDLDLLAAQPVFERPGKRPRGKGRPGAPR